MNALAPTYKLIKGKITDLFVENENIHYLNSIKQTQEAAGVVSVLQAALGEAGAVNTSQVATAEGDAVQAFIMYIEGRKITGSFWASSFSNGDCVTVIGEEQEGEFKAIAVVKPEDRLIWMSPYCERGTLARKHSLIRNSLWFAAVNYFFGISYLCIYGWAGMVRFPVFHRRLADIYIYNYRA